MDSFVSTFLAQLALAWAAPAVVLPLVAAVATAVWAVRGTFEESAKQGLKEQNDALKANLALAKEGSPELKKEVASMASDYKKEMEAVKAQIQRLEEQIVSDAPRKEIESTTQALSSQIATLSSNDVPGRVADWLNKPITPMSEEARIRIQEIEALHRRWQSKKEQ